MLILPSFVLAIIFCYVPMGGLVMAFQDCKPWLGITGSQFVGMDNFRQIFEFKESYQAIINTLIIAVSKIILGLIVPIIMALLLNEVHNIGLKKGIQTLVYLPHFLSWVTVAGMLRDILGTDGIVNMVLQKFGIDPIFFLGEAGMFRQIVVASDLWKGFGFGMIVYLAAISNMTRAPTRQPRWTALTAGNRMAHYTSGHHADDHRHGNVKPWKRPECRVRPDLQPVFPTDLQHR